MAPIGNIACLGFIYMYVNMKKLRFDWHTCELIVYTKLKYNLYMCVYECVCVLAFRFKIDALIIFIHFFYCFCCIYSVLLLLLLCRLRWLRMAILFVLFRQLISVIRMYVLLKCREQKGTMMLDK